MESGVVQVILKYCLDFCIFSSNTKLPRPKLAIMSFWNTNMRSTISDSQLGQCLLAGSGFRNSYREAGISAVAGAYSEIPCS